MIKTIYGEVTKEQVQRQKKSIHDAIHWLLIYKDPKIMETGKYKNINVDRYMVALGYRISGLNELFLYPDCLITLLSLLEGARIELNSENYEWSTFRKIILDAHSLVDEIKEE